MSENMSIKIAGSPENGAAGVHKFRNNIVSDFIQYSRKRIPPIRVVVRTPKQEAAVSRK